MKAYVVVTETINDQAMFDAYRKEVPATLTPFGGEFVVRGGNLTILEGIWQHPRLVIISFRHGKLRKIGTSQRRIRK